MGVGSLYFLLYFSCGGFALLTVAVAVILVVWGRREEKKIEGPGGNEGGREEGSHSPDSSTKLEDSPYLSKSRATGKSLEDSPTKPQGDILPESQGEGDNHLQ